MPPAASRPALLISSCLLGRPVRYDGQGKAQPDAMLARLREVFELVPACPELLGGLPVPRPPAEIVGGSGPQVLAGVAVVRERSGGDVSAAFVSGAQQALALARERGCRHALLKAFSPSCGNRAHYDGSFTGAHRAGQGVAAALLAEAGLMVWNEDEVDALLRAVADAVAEDAGADSTLAASGLPR